MAVSYKGRTPTFVFPAQAGIQFNGCGWIPACAGMMRYVSDKHDHALTWLAAFDMLRPNGFGGAALLGEADIIDPPLRGCLEQPFAS